MINRRQFLGEASCAAIGSTSVLSTLLNLTMANHAAAANNPVDSRKALVCIYLGGGCDTFNLLIPREPIEAYNEYAAARSNLAIPRGDLIPLNFTDSQGRSYGMHPSCPNLAAMFNGTAGGVVGKKLSMLSNIGTLVEPIANKTDYQNRSVALPKALFSHRDQTEQWQTSVPQGMDILTGWAGRAADVIHSTYNTEQTGGYYMPMNFSLAGNSTFQIGQSQGQFVITSKGALGLSGNDVDSAVYRAKKQLIGQVVESPIEDHYRNLFQRTHGRITGNSIERGEQFGNVIESPGSVNGLDINAVIEGAGFYNHPLSDSFKAAAKTIAVREQLQLRRQTIFIEFGGWDHHNELLNSQASMLTVLDNVLHSFQKALTGLGLSDDVVTFSCSDFGRTLRSNGQGTDHAWAGNQFALGGPVDGGTIKGTFPSLVINGVDDIGRGGRIFPRTSPDEYFGELLNWFGVSNGDLPTVLPNVGRFYDPTMTNRPLGFLA